MRKPFFVLACFLISSCTTVSAKKANEVVESGNAQAIFELALKYENGDGLKKDITQALKLYEKAATLGNAGAQVNLGWFYQNGQHLEKNIDRALDLYAKAAHQGDPQAQLNLGVLYDEGVDIAENNELAVKWYEMAAAQRNDTAQLNLAINYWKGEGVGQNYEKAWDLLNQVRIKSSNPKLRWRARSALDEIKSEVKVDREKINKFSYPAWDKLVTSNS